MKFIDDINISSKLLVPMVVMALSFSGVIALGSRELTRTASDYAEMTEKTDPSVVELMRLSRASAALGYDLYKSTTLACLGADAQICRSLDQSLAANIQEGVTSLARAKHLDPQHLEDYQRFEDRFGSAARIAAEAMAMSDQDRNAEAAKAMGEADPQIRQFASELHTYNERRLAETKARSTMLTAEAHRALWTMVLIGAVAIVTGLAATGWIVMTGVSRPLVRLAGRMKSLAGGDLAVQVEGVDRGDEIGGMAKALQVFKDNGLKLQSAETEAAQTRQAAEDERQRTDAAKARAARELTEVVEGLAAGLASLSSGDLTYRIADAFAPDYEKLRTDFNSAMDSLRDALTTISAATQGLRAGAEEIATASDDMSRRTEQQAANLEESAAALDQVTGTVARSAEGARRVADIVSEARVDATRSGEVVGEAVSAMAEIEQSSKQINQIIGVIDEIAFQTNLLALNAGVEAARAGEVGRGFAVVAQEVRALAQRSAEAAKEIKVLIAASSGHVERGVDLVRHTGEALHGIVGKVADMDSLVLEIAASAQEQATGLNQVNAAVAQMDQTTQRNTAMVEETTAAAANLKAEAHKLSALVSRFRTGQADAAADVGAGNRVRQLQARVASGLARA